jgi:hypothetical protein
MNFLPIMLVLNIIYSTNPSANPNFAVQQNTDRLAGILYNTSLDEGAPLVPSSADEIRENRIEFMLNLTNALGIYLFLEEDFDALDELIEGLNKSDVLIGQLKKKSNLFKYVMEASLKGYEYIARLLYHIDRERHSAFTTRYKEFMVSLNYSKMAYDYMIMAINNSSKNDGYIKNSDKGGIMYHVKIGKDVLEASLNVIMDVKDDFIEILADLEKLHSKRRKIN